MKIPLEIINIADKLSANGYKSYLVGGCVRDMFLEKDPKDWDIATNAEPDEIQKIFPQSVYENSFGTVAVKTGSNKGSLKLIEITTFRSEGKYTDKRHPDEIKFAKTIEEDLSRRDFTINAMALEVGFGSKAGDLIDPYKGGQDLSVKAIRCVGKAEERFSEDALRLMRAVRLATELKFSIEKETKNAIERNSDLLGFIAKERIRDEFVRIVMASEAEKGLRLLEECCLVKNIIPELREGIDCTQNKHHVYTVWEHGLLSLKYAASKNYSLEIRLAALLHDIGKPETKRGAGEDATFYSHEIVGAKMVYQILKDLRFSNEVVERVTHLVRYHLFYYNVGDVTEAGVRRFIKRVGLEYIPDLIKVREADRIGSGVPKAIPYKLRHLLFMIEKVKKDPISPKMLMIHGKEIMEIAGLKPSPKVGQILDILLDEVLEDPVKNNEKYLQDRVLVLSKKSKHELEELQDKARDSKNEFEKGIEQEIKGKYFVK